LKRSILHCCSKRAKPRAANRARRPGSSIFNRSRPPRAANRVVMTQLRRSRGANAKLRPIFAVCCLLVGAGGASRRCPRSRRWRARYSGHPRQLFPWLSHLFADSVHNGLNLREALKLAKFGKWTIEIVQRTADAPGFQLLPSVGSSNEQTNSGLA